MNLEFLHPHLIGNLLDGVFLIGGLFGIGGDSHSASSQTDQTVTASGLASPVTSGGTRSPVNTGTSINLSGKATYTPISTDPQAFGTIGNIFNKAVDAITKADNTNTQTVKTLGDLFATNQTQLSDLAKSNQTGGQSDTNSVVLKIAGAAFAAVAIIVLAVVILTGRSKKS